MNITFVPLTALETCRGCDCEQIELESVGGTIEEAEKDWHQQLEAENWTDGLCPDCAEKKFLQ